MCRAPDRGSARNKSKLKMQRVFSLEFSCSHGLQHSLDKKRWSTLHYWNGASKECLPRMQGGLRPSKKAWPRQPSTNKYKKYKKIQIQKWTSKNRESMLAMWTSTNIKTPNVPKWFLCTPEIKFALLFCPCQISGFCFCHGRSFCQSKRCFWLPPLVSLFWFDQNWL